MISRLINFVRFPMIIGIIFIHSRLNLGLLNVSSSSLPFYNVVENFFYNGFTRIFVPLFFFISGFLFFYKTDLTFSVYKLKIKKRVKSLLLPYLIFNTIALFVFAVFQEFFPGLISDGKMPIADYGIMQYAEAYGIGHLPIVGPSWFLRNLLIIALLTPIIYIYIRKTKELGLGLLACLWLLKIVNLSIPTIGDIFFFSFGAYFSIFNKDVILTLRRFRYYSYFLYPIILFTCLLLHIQQHTFLFELGIIVGIFFFLNICQALLEKYGPINHFLVSSAFFLYIFHEPYFDQFKKVLLLIYPNISNVHLLDLSLVVSFFLFTILFIMILLAFYKLLISFFPKTMGLILGERK